MPRMSPAAIRLNLSTARSLDGLLRALTVAQGRLCRKLDEG